MNKLKRYLLFLVGLFINALGVSPILVSTDLPQRFQNTPLFYSKLCGYELNFGAVALDKISID